MPKHKLLIRHRWALGDTVLMTALVRDIHRAYPGQYETGVDTHFSNVWWHNPYVTKFSKTDRPQRVTVAWGDAIRSNGFATVDGERVKKHILAWYHHDFERQTGLKVPVTEPKADLHLSEKERRPIVEGRYWVTLAGGKLDITNKHWRFTRYQEVVDCLLPYGVRFVQTGATHTNHVHPPLNRVINMVGQTDNARDLFNLILHADGVLCPVTSAMHIAAAYDKPCVVIAGGREEPWFEAYTNQIPGIFGKQCAPVRIPHRFLHTLGLLHCCDKVGCWKRRTVPLETADLNRKSHELCKEPVKNAGQQAVALCMDKITTDHVCEAIMSYYDSGELPPISEPEKKYSAPQETAQPLPESPQMSRMPTVTEEPPPPLVIPNIEPQVIRPPSSPVKRQTAKQKAAPVEYGRKGPKTSKRLEVLQHPLIGNKITLTVVCFGPHPEIAKRCLESVLTTTPRELLDIRVGLNAVANETLQFVKSIKPDKIYNSQENILKYPMLRRMFWDPEAPLKTRVAVHLDDDVQVTDPMWLVRLAETIVANHKHGARLFGTRMCHDLKIFAKDGHNPLNWFKKADWWRGRHLRARGTERISPSGSVIDFAVGYAWAICTDTIRACNIPDPRLTGNGGDICIGEQVHQAGYKIAQWNKGKSLITTPKKEQGGRRPGGVETSFPWAQQQFEREYWPAKK